MLAYFDIEAVTNITGSLLWIIFIVGVIVGAFFLIRAAVRSGIKAAKKDENQNNDKNGAP